jgi:hypothetical protein
MITEQQIMDEEGKAWQDFVTDEEIIGEIAHNQVEDAGHLASGLDPGAVRAAKSAVAIQVHTQAVAARPVNAVATHIKCTTTTLTGTVLAASPTTSH